MFDATKIIFLQKNRILLSGIAVTLACEINYHITRRIVSPDGDLVLHVAAVAAGLGFIIAGLIKVKYISNPYFEIFRSQHMEEIKEAHEFLLQEHIKHDVMPCMNKDLTAMDCFVIYASPSTPGEKAKIAKFIKQSESKFNHTVVG